MASSRSWGLPTLCQGVGGCTKNHIILTSRQGESLEASLDFPPGPLEVEGADGGMEHPKENQSGWLSMRQRETAPDPELAVHQSTRAPESRGS
jgi:hypothetical protein